MQCSSVLGHPWAYHAMQQRVGPSLGILCNAAACWAIPGHIMQCSNASGSNQRMHKAAAEQGPSKAQQCPEPATHRQCRRAPRNTAAKAVHSAVAHSLVMHSAQHMVCCRACSRKTMLRDACKTTSNALSLAYPPSRSQPCGRDCTKDRACLPLSICA